MSQKIAPPGLTTSPRASGRAPVASAEQGEGWVKPGHGHGLLRPFRTGQVDVERGNTALRQVRQMAKAKSPEITAKLIDIALHDQDTRVAVVACQTVLTWAHGRPENLKPDDGEPRAKLDLSKLTPGELKVLLKLVDSPRFAAAPEPGGGDDVQIDGALVTATGNG